MRAGERADERATSAQPHDKRASDKRSRSNKERVRIDKRTHPLMGVSSIAVSLAKYAHAYARGASTGKGDPIE
jgi:hypothetical protein